MFSVTVFHSGQQDLALTLKTELCQFDLEQKTHSSKGYNINLLLK